MKCIYFINTFQKLAIIFLLLFSMYAKCDVIDVSFDAVYPPSFFDTFLGKATTITVGAAVSAGLLFVVVSTAGAGGSMLASAGTFYTTVGSKIGLIAGAGSGSAAYGLALLGGGSIANGGFGIAGGVFVINMVVGLGTGISLEALNDNFKNNSEISTICNNIAYPAKMPLPRIGTPQIIYLVKQISTLEQEGKIDSNQYATTYYELKINLDSVKHHSDLTTLESLLVRGVFRFNNAEDYKLTNDDFEYLRKHSIKSGFIDFMQAMVELQQSNKQKSIDLLNQAISKEPYQLNPYYWLIMLYKNSGQFPEALAVSKEGIKSLKKQRFPLLWEAGKITYLNKNFQEAGRFFEEAFDHVDDFTVQAEVAHMIAISKWKTRDYENSNKWHETSVKTLDKIENQQEKSQKKKEMHRLWLERSNGGHIYEITLEMLRREINFLEKCLDKQ